MYVCICWYTYARDLKVAHVRVEQSAHPTMQLLRYARATRRAWAYIG